MFWRAKKTTVSSPSKQGLEEAKPVAGVSSGTVMAPRNSDSLAPPLSENGASAVSESVVMVPGGCRPFVLPSSYIVSGNLFTSRPVVIGGILDEGELVAPLAVILPGGQLRATTRVDVLKVYGSVCAEITAHQSVQVFDNGKVGGSIESPEMSVAQGALVSCASLSVGPKRSV